MLKPPTFLKQSNPSMDEAILETRGFLSHVPFIQVEPIQEGLLGHDLHSRPDFIARLNIGDERWDLIAEYTREGHPKQIRAAVQQLRDYLSQLPHDRKYGLVVAPFISEQSAKICREAGIGFFDLSGNAELSFDRVFIRTRTGRNRFRTGRTLHSLFSPKAGRVLSVLLTPPLRVWKVTDLQTAADVSLGLVSNVRKLLLNQEWAVAEETGLRITKPEDLLRAWRKHYRKRTQSKVTFYTLHHGDSMDAAVRNALAAAGNGQHAVLASFSAARWIAPYVRQATNFFYADAEGTEVLKSHLQLESATQGENVVIEEPREDDVFLDRIETAPNVWTTGLVQTWLDLSMAGERGIEAAEHLLEYKLLPGWKESV